MKKTKAMLQTKNHISPRVTIVVENGSISEIYATDQSILVDVIDKDATLSDQEEENDLALETLESEVDGGKMHKIV